MLKKPRTFAAKADVDPVLDRPFATALWKKARRIAGRYKIVIWFEDGEWYGRGFELPLTMSDGATPDECVAHVREAMALSVASMLEDNQTPPRAGVEGGRHMTRPTVLSGG